MPPIHMTGRAPGFDYDLFFEVDPGTQSVFPFGTSSSSTSF
jgi:hypothetical protein